MRFDELALCNEVQQGLEAMNFTEATPVQAETIPYSNPAAPRS